MLDELLDLSADDLKEVSRALRSGRLRPPVTALGLQRFCGSESDREAVVRQLQDLLDDGMSVAHMAVLLETLARDRGRRGPSSVEHLEFVWTGPQPEGLASRDTAVVVRELFSTAETSVLVAGFAVYQGRQVFRALADRMDEHRELEVRMFLDVQRSHTDTSTDDEILRRFAHRFKTQEWPGDRLPEVYYDPRSLAPRADKRACLHAKCIVVDRKIAFITSANFTEAAQERNIEVGVLLHSPDFVRGLQGHFEVLARTGVLQRVGGLG